MRATAPRVPVIYLAVSGNEWLAAAAIRYGATDYLPLDLVRDADIVRSVKTCLAGGRLPALLRGDDEQAVVGASNASVSALSRGSLHGTAHLHSGAAQALADAPDIPGYRIVRAVGQGGTSVTYLALDEHRQRQVVIKFMPFGDHASNIDAIRVFKREYEVIAGLNDRRVVRIFGSGVREDGAYLVVEYFPGGDLARRMRRPVTTHAALGYARQIAQALQLIHARGVFHRDLKPGNIMMRQDGSVALIDFGLAKLSVGQTLAKAGRVLGTPSYLSPEQALGREVAEGSDIYSLGCVLYELLTGKRPYAADSAVRMIDMHVKAPVPDLPDDLMQLQPLIDRSMAKDPQERYESAGAFIAGIDEALRALPMAQHAAG
jgi:serine/threonine protein kinase